MAAEPRIGEALDKVIVRIADDMCAGRWRAGASHRQYSEEFGVIEDTVRNWAAQACRYLRLSIGDKTELRARILGRIETLAEEAASKKSYRAALEAWAMLGNAYGVLTPDPSERNVEVSFEYVVELLERQGYRIEKMKEEDSGK